MTPRRIHTLAIILGLFVLTFASETSAKPLNVLMIIIDDLRPELDCYGVDSMVTPNINRLAEKGMKFNHAYCQYPVCNPSRSSFLTSKRPDELDITNNSVSLREKWPDLVTLPQAFRNAGYFTAGLGKILHVGLDDNGEKTLFRDTASFDHSYKALGNSPSIGKKGVGRTAGDGSISWCNWLAAEGGDEAQPDGMIAAEAIRVLEEHHDKPFFIGVGFHKPHDPFHAPKEYFEHYPLDEIELAEDPKDRIPLLKYALPPKSYDFSKFTEQDCREIKRAYQACTSFTDAQVGKLFDTLDRLELWEDTIVMIMGDHGYHLGEHGWWNKVTLFELGARAPMIMWVPNAKGMGNEASAIVEFLDIYPTLIDYCDIEAPHKLSGKSLRPVLEDSQKWRGPAFTQVRRPKVNMGYSVCYGPYRFTQWGEEGQGGYELYNTMKDHDGYYNLADNPDFKKIRNKLEGMLKDGFPELAR